MVQARTRLTIPSFGQVDLSTEPNVQKTTARSCSALPTYWRSDVTAEKRYMTAIPARTIVSLPIPR